ncbi:MAG: response regulator [Planctomycetes bacterium]|nr:response regulator [Planctomycetota bacterium]
MLYVDDNRDTADSAADFLRHFGLDVTVCYDGASARAVGPDFAPDVCMFDLNMPGMDGDELLVAFQNEAPPSKRVLYVAVTATGNEAARIRTTEVGFHLHFVTPVSLHALLHVVETWGEVIQANPPSSDSR